MKRVFFIPIILLSILISSISFAESNNDIARIHYDKGYEFMDKKRYAEVIKELNRVIELIFKYADAFRGDGFRDGNSYGK